MLDSKDFGGLEPVVQKSEESEDLRSNEKKLLDFEALLNDTSRNRDINIEKGNRDENDDNDDDDDDEIARIYQQAMDKSPFKKLRNQKKQKNIQEKKQKKRSCNSKKKGCDIYQRLLNKQATKKNTKNDVNKEEEEEVVQKSKQITLKPIKVPKKSQKSKSKSKKRSRTPLKDRQAILNQVEDRLMKFAIQKQQRIDNILKNRKEEEEKENRKLFHPNIQKHKSSKNLTKATTKDPK